MPARAFVVEVLDMPHHRLGRIALPARHCPQYAQAEEAVRQSLADALWQGHTRAAVDAEGSAGRVRVPRRGWQGIPSMLDGMDRYRGAVAWLEEQAAQSYSGRAPGALREVHVQVNKAVPG